MYTYVNAYAEISRYVYIEREVCVYIYNTYIYIWIRSDWVRLHWIGVDWIRLD